MIEIYKPPAFHLEITHPLHFPMVVRYGARPEPYQLITKDDKHLIIDQVKLGLSADLKQTTFYTHELNDFDPDRCPGVIISQLDEYERWELYVQVAFNTHQWTVHIQIPYFISEVHANLIREGLKTAVCISNQPMSCLVERTML